MIWELGIDYWIIDYSFPGRGLPQGALRLETGAGVSPVPIYGTMIA